MTKEEKIQGHTTRQLFALLQQLQCPEESYWDDVTPEFTKEEIGAALKARKGWRQ